MPFPTIPVQVAPPGLGEALINTSGRNGPFAWNGNLYSLRSNHYYDAPSLDIPAVPDCAYIIKSVDSGNTWTIATTVTVVTWGGGGYLPLYDTGGNDGAIQVGRYLYFHWVNVVVAIPTLYMARFDMETDTLTELFSDPLTIFDRWAGWAPLSFPWTNDGCICQKVICDLPNGNVVLFYVSSVTIVGDQKEFNLGYCILDKDTGVWGTPTTLMSESGKNHYPFRALRSGNLIHLITGSDVFISNVVPGLRPFPTQVKGAVNHLGLDVTGSSISPGTLQEVITTASAYYSNTLSGDGAHRSVGTLTVGTLDGVDSIIFTAHNLPDVQTPLKIYSGENVLDPSAWIAEEIPYPPVIPIPSTEVDGDVWSEYYAIEEGNWATTAIIGGLLNIFQGTVHIDVNSDVNHCYLWRIIRTAANTFTYEAIDIFYADDPGNPPLPDADANAPAAQMANVEILAISGGFGIFWTRYVSYFDGFANPTRTLMYLGIPTATRKNSVRYLEC